MGTGVGAAWDPLNRKSCAGDELSAASSSAVPPPLARVQPAVLREGGLEWAGGCSGVTLFVGWGSPELPPLPLSWPALSVWVLLLTLP